MSIRRLSIMVLATIGSVILSIGGAQGQPASLSDYEARVAAAANLVEQTAGAYEDESFSEPARIQQNLQWVRQKLPAQETVELNGHLISVNNGWLHEALSDYDKTAGHSRQGEILMRVAEQLKAIGDRARELKTASLNATDKDADKGRLAEILRRPEYLQTAPEVSALERLINRFLRWLGRLFPQPEPIKPGSSSAISGVAQIIIIAIFIVVIALVIWRYGPRLFRERRQKKKKREARVVLGERLEPDQTAADLLAQAETLARAGDLRAAIRKGYIALLCELGDRKLISLAQHKTNRDYLNSVRDKRTLYGAMRQLTHSFEVHWYGFVPPAEKDWIEFRNGYQQVLGTG